MRDHYTQAERDNLLRLRQKGKLAVSDDWRGTPAWMGLAADGLVVETVLHGRFKAVELTPAGKAAAAALGDRQ